ncbi:MAG: hypothetical protein NTX50_11120 [Candidatus Sumerlaeota bacterium]|nr:hypothetical protein [Candidatus Sumerlaeota bacterium]
MIPCSIAPSSRIGRRIGARLQALGLLLAALAAMHCGKTEFVIEDGTPAAAGGKRAAAAATSMSVLQQIQAAPDVFDLHEIGLAQEKRKEKDPAVLSALKARQAELIGKIKPMRLISPSLDLVAFRYKMIKPEYYRLYWLMHCKKALGKDYIFRVSGYVDPIHIAYLPKEWISRKCTVWDFDPKPPASQWKTGDYIFLTDEVFAAAIPYNIKLIMQANDGSRLNGDTAVDLGWYADLGS